jgi:hypothetical protein
MLAERPAAVTLGLSPRGRLPLKQQQQQMLHPREEFKTPAMDRAAAAAGDNDGISAGGSEYVAGHRHLMPDREVFALSSDQVGSCFPCPPLMECM